MHEQSITFPINEQQTQWINTSGVYKGRNISEDEALELYKAGKLQRFGPIFPDVDSANRAAEMRSRMFGEDEKVNARAILPDILSTIHWPYR